MPRPRTIPDARILDATERVVAREGPIRFTLEDVAREARVSPALLLQRFETKRGLLLALAARGAPGVREAFAAAAKGRRPLDALVEALVRIAGEPDPRAIANGLALLQLDVTDAAFREHAIAFFDAFREETAAALALAMDAGELPRQDVHELARAVEMAYQGAILTWALRQEGKPEDALREALAAIGIRPRKRSR